ncbi:MAG: NAD-dependent epimerase/dehydratase family protein [Proteobacteria bacterium]|nr:NAD-dependent epimerase/dehydratase family protein [Pseudomonadota bacterium]MBU4297823.1 NAD-dependent epimerase/dehydratase family protein [Pseudomonadota bacterium]MCG2748655.1 NAD-dependent epimerase/dehydratase family protein [Desulfobulbaceae bacterium]
MKSDTNYAKLSGKRVLITGVNGFVGRHLAEYLHAGGVGVSGTRRSNDGPLPGWVNGHSLSLPANEKQLDTVLAGCDFVVHLAGRVHQRDEEGDDLRQAYHSVNVLGTLQLARQAVRAGVKRFVFVSTIKVNGERTFGRPFTAADQSAPLGDYAVSKYEAEQGLLEIAVRQGLEVVIVRPPLVYGDEVKGNLARLQGLIKKGVPLPLASIRNKRDLISIGNLCDVIAITLVHPAAANEIFLVADGVPFSTPDLVRFLAGKTGRRARLFPFPVSLLRLAGTMTSRKPLVDRLCDSLEVNTEKTVTVLGWHGIPPR